MTKIEHNLDLMGLKCPLPVLKISKKFKEISIGDIINAKCDDPKAETDIKNLCDSIKMKLIGKKKKKNCFYFKLLKI